MSFKSPSCKQEMVWSNTRIGIGPILVKMWSLRSNAVINIQPSTGRPRLRNGNLWRGGGKKKALDQYLESADSLCCSICIEHDTDTSDVTIEQSHDLRGPWKWPTETHGRFWISSHSPTHSLTHSLPSDCLIAALLTFICSFSTAVIKPSLSSESWKASLKDSRIPGVLSVTSICHTVKCGPFVALLTVQKIQPVISHCKADALSTLHLCGV